MYIGGWYIPDDVDVITNPYVGKINFSMTAVRTLEGLEGNSINRELQKIRVESDVSPEECRNRLIEAAKKTL